jgi:phosphatidate phosphatase
MNNKTVQKERDPSPKVHIMSIIYDVFVLIALLAIYGSLVLWTKPFNSSFYCNDFSINSKFYSSTVTNAVLIIVSLVMPIVFILFTEVFRAIHLLVLRKRQNNTSIQLYTISVKKYKILFFNRCFDLREEFVHLYANIGYFLIGLSATGLITNIGKTVVGRLRPNFLDVCKPDRDPYSQVCSLSKNIVIPGVDFLCTTSDKSAVEESRKSFPSGHSSLSAYSCIFLVLFINSTWSYRRIGAVPRLIQIGLLILTFYIGISRVVDNKHHPTDVIAGFIIGTIMAILTYYILNKFLTKTKYHVFHKGQMEENSSQNDEIPLYLTNNTNPAFLKSPKDDKRNNDLNNNEICNI